MQKSKQQSREEIVVFSIVRESKCGECGEELRKGRLLRRENDKALCLACADLDHLVFLPSGDATLTRRSKKYSKLYAVVVRFSRARKRYERQGLLVEESALEQAEQECLDDEEARLVARERAAERRAELDEQFVKKFGKRVRARFPGCPEGEEQKIAEHACLKYSGRVGRSAAAKEFDSETIDLAVRARVRHVHTNYDELLAQGWDRHEAREAVYGEVDDVLDLWRAR